jgi:hypothetical protein
VLLWALLWVLLWALLWVLLWALQVLPPLGMLLVNTWHTASDRCLSILHRAHARTFPLSIPTCSSSQSLHNQCTHLHHHRTVSVCHNGNGRARLPAALGHVLLRLLRFPTLQKKSNILY